MKLKLKIVALILGACLSLASCAGTQPQNLNGTAATPSSEEKTVSQEASLAGSETEQENGIILPEAVGLQQSGVDIVVNPAMELLSIVQYLSEYDAQYGLLTGLPISYVQDVEEFFRPYEDHEAVQFINKNMNKGFNFDKPPSALLYLNPDFSLEEDFFGSEAEQNMSKVDMTAFVQVLKDFYVESGFQTFYIDHLDYYQEILENTAAQFPDWNMIGAMEDFYGKSMSGYQIQLVSLFHPGGYGPSVERADGTWVYSILGPLDSADALPRFGSVDSFSELVLHEFGHSFILVSEMEIPPDIEEALKESSYLMKSVQEEMERMAYPEWPTACEELILRAVVIRLLEENQGNDPASLLHAEKANGFIHINEVYGSVARYQKNQGNYENFDEFIPALLQDLMEDYPNTKYD